METVKMQRALFPACEREGGRAKQRPGESMRGAGIGGNVRRVDSPRLRCAGRPSLPQAVKRVTATFTLLIIGSPICYAQKYKICICFVKKISLNFVFN